ncbi:MAG: hypothetical protein ABI211_08655 [Vicinamibacterales bacterium]
MTGGDRAAFAELMLGVGEAYGETVSAARLEIYFRGLEDVSLEAIRAAATVHVRTSRFFPRVADLREGIDGSADDRADLAWVQLLQLVRRVGYYGTPAWTDPVAERAAIELFGGWQALCARLPGDGPELLGAAKVFKSTYATYARRDARELALTLPSGREETRGQLLHLRDELVKRGLPAPGLPS